MLAQLPDVLSKSFDYVIIGGGTAGLTVASRLVQDPKTSVLVLEAGESNLDDPNILLGGRFGLTFGDPKYDWYSQTVPQKYCNNRVIPWGHGKGLGGSSALNFHVWTKPSAADINAFEELGNPGWNWESYQEVLLRVEEFTAASEDQLKEYAHTHNNKFRGKSGPIKTTVPYINKHVTKMFLETLKSKGIPLLDDPYGGNVTGCWLAASNLDRRSRWTRSYAATAYYLPNEDKPNFSVLTKAICTRVLFNDEWLGGELVANGVEFAYEGKLYSVHVKKEVICSAGTNKSPQILELSGIGCSDVLSNIGVPLKIQLPGVGENLQDHPVCGISYELDPQVSLDTFDVFRDPELAKEQTRLQGLNQNNMHRHGFAALCYLPLSVANPDEAPPIIEGIEAHVDHLKKSRRLPPGLAEQYDIQLRMLKDDSLPDTELLAYAGFMTFQTVPENKPHLTVLVALQRPFSRGSVHAKSSNPLDEPDIDPCYFENPYDLEILTQHIKLTRELANTEPFKSGYVREVDPGPEAKTDAHIKEYLKNCTGTCYHAIGTLSMLPREKNGVVDSELRVRDPHAIHQIRRTSAKP
ncbi:hypothetical protein AcV5_008351 [Taiwanofungus camphoratus]|nr:hypothetical protein AcV5_008351 [Antrodia cinnamomea]